MDENIALQKKEKLISRLSDLESLLVAYSGGVDSTFLLAVAQEALGEGVVGATAATPAYPSREKEAAVAFAEQRGISHILFESDETCIPEFIANNPDRCYHCKKSLSRELLEIADQKGIAHVAHAANTDDLGDYRPGMQAAVEMGLIAPLLDARLNKDEIRFLSREMGLPTWDKSAMACLASRIPYGETITEEKLRMVGEAETFLAGKGFKQYRVRYHGKVARIEVNTADLEKMIAPALREEVVQKFRAIGFQHIALDLEGYITGSLNRALKA
jgi:uncharacterized protein